MKKLLTTLVTLTTVVIPVITTTNLIVNSIVNSKLDANVNYCHKSLQMISKPLFPAINDDNVKLTITLGATYGEIDKVIYNTATVFKEHPLVGNYTVDYYKNDGDTETINNEGQMPGDAYVIITADLHDPHWKGKTKYLKITIEKANLNKITTFTDLPNIKVSLKKKYSEIGTEVFEKTKEFTTHRLGVGFTVNYFSDVEGTLTVDDDNQKVGDVYVKITAVENDPYWTGATSVIKITLTSDKTDLISITTLEDMPIINIVADKPNKEIDINNYNKSKSFEINQLAEGFIVNYFSDAEATVAADDVDQVAGDIYVMITAAENDPYWSGTTSVLTVTLTDARSDLNTINDLSGMDPIIVNPNLTYQEINKNVINSCNQLKTSPLTGNFTIHYFSDIAGKHRIDHHFQQIGIVYVIITPDYHTGTKWKANQSPINFIIVE